MWLYVSSCPKLFFSDDFIQAQQQLARWASEDVVSVVVMDPERLVQEKNLSAVVPLPAVMAQNIIHPITASHMGNGLGATVSRTDYYPSPPSTTETESSGSVMAHQQLQQQQQQQKRGPQEHTGHYPEYKH